MIGISVPRRERRLPRVLDWSQVEQIVAGERKPRDRAILALLAYGGLRRGEVMAADVGDYSREAPSLMVHGKGNKDRASSPLHRDRSDRARRLPGHPGPASPPSTRSS